MFPAAVARLPKTLDGPANLPYLVEANSRKAYAHKAESAVHLSQAEAIKTRNGGAAPEIGPDKIAYHEALSAANKHLELAQLYHGNALQSEKDHKDSLTTFQRLHPTMMKTLFGTAIAAEIISIPVLLMTCLTMTKPHRQSPSSGPAATN